MPLTYTPHENRSIMRFEGGLSALLEMQWSKSVCPAPVEFRGMMMSSSIDHTEDFYGKAYVASRALTYREVTQPGVDHGGYLFTRDEKSGTLSFGVEPEHPLTQGCVCGKVRGEVIDQTIGSMGVSEENPFTGCMQDSVKSIRELCGQRIPYSHWEEWMGRMYGKGVPTFTPKPKMGAPFGEAGRVARVVVTFQSREQARLLSPSIVKMWEGMRSGKRVMQLMEEAEKGVIMDPRVRGALDHVSRCIKRGEVGMQSMMSDQTLNTLVLTAVMPRENPIPASFPAASFPTAITPPDK